MRTYFMVVVVVLLVAERGLGSDWPQFLGPTRDGVYAGSDIALSWPAAGPPVRWKRAVGQGFSAPVGASGRLILHHRIGDQEVVECLDAETSEPVWSFKYATDYDDDFGFDEGPRGTPAIALGRVYAFGAGGMLHCLDFATGDVRWHVDTRTRFGARKGFFGAACSPLVDGNRVLVGVGGPRGAGLVAFDAADGTVLWHATDHEAGYASPVVATIEGDRHAFFFTRAGLVDVDPSNGRVRFEHPWRARISASVNAATPLVIGNLVFVSASYRTGAIVLRVRSDGAETLWSAKDVLSNHYATSVHHDGYLYGYDGRQEAKANLRCVELRSGNVKWSRDRFGSGTVTRVGDRLLLVGETGVLTLAAAAPERFTTIAAAPIVSGTVRAHTALAGGRLYLRNTDTLFCVDLRASK